MKRSLIHAPRDPLDFTPVPRRKARDDGWTPARQRAFIAMLAETGNVRRACAAVGLQFSGAYRLRDAAGGEEFRAAWDAAIECGMSQVRDLLIDHSLNGVPEPVYHAGKLVGERRRFNHRTMMWVVEHGEKRAERAAAKPHAGPAAQPAEAKADGIKVCMLLDASVLFERKRLRKMLDSPEKRAAFEVLWGPFKQAGFAFHDVKPGEGRGNWSSYCQSLVMQEPPEIIYSQPPVPADHLFARHRAD